MTFFCTISTNSNLFKTYALADSIANFSGKLLILMMDDIHPDLTKEKPKNVQFFSLKEIQSDLSLKLIKKYKSDKLRWSLKPVFLIYLLQQYEKVIYVDNDIYFFNDFQFLVNDLDSNDIILSPHFYPSSPEKEQNWLEANHRLGLYNAGFIGVNKKAIPALEWWGKCCLYAITKSYWRGLFDDQKYLDLLPVKYDRVKILKQRGCNLAGWNDDINLAENEVIFIHFNSFTLKKFKINTHIYFSYFKSYLLAIKKYNTDFKIKSYGINKFSFQNAIYFIKWTLVNLLK